MKQTIQKLHRLLEQEEGLALQDYIRILYEACEKHPYCNEADILQVREELEAHLADMAFRQQDCILSTVNALCATYDYAGFSEGFRRGSELVLRMVGSK
mgnify:CR=1 FL=1